MTPPDPWTARLRTARAAGLLCLTVLLVVLVPLRWWRRSLGPVRSGDNHADPATARRLAAHIERAAWRLPFACKCLPQAIALSWQLRHRSIDHRMVFAARPPGQREAADALHAWIECSDEVILGELPGPWLRVYGLPD